MTIDNDGVLTLNSFDGLFSLLKELINDPDEVTIPESFSFAEELDKLEIYIEGDQYHSSIPGSFTRGLWEYQESIYRAVAYALYGSPDLRKLTNPDLEKYNLIFHVSEGSSRIWAIVGQFATDLGSSIKDMSDTHKALTILGIFAILTYGYNSYTATQATIEAEVEMAKIEAEVAMAEANVSLEKARLDAQIKLEEERNELMKAVVQQNQVVHNFYENTGEGTKSLLKHAGNATSIKMGKSYFDSDAIEEARVRAAREDLSL